jgi:hypothetical protein
MPELYAVHGAYFTVEAVLVSGREKEGCTGLKDT